MAVGSTKRCDKCGQSYDSGATGHYVCDDWSVEFHKASKFIENYGYGFKAKLFDKNDVVDLLIAYKDENSKS